MVIYNPGNDRSSQWSRQCRARVTSRYVTIRILSNLFCARNDGSTFSFSEQAFASHFKHTEAPEDPDHDQRKTDTFEHHVLSLSPITQTSNDFNVVFACLQYWCAGVHTLPISVLSFVLPPPPHPYPSLVFWTNKTRLNGFLLTSKRTSVLRWPFQGKRSVLHQTRAAWKANISKKETYKQTEHREKINTHRTKRKRIAHWIIQQTLWLEVINSLLCCQVNSWASHWIFLRSTSFFHSETWTTSMLGIDWFDVRHRLVSDQKKKLKYKTEIVILYKRKKIHKH